MDRSRQNAPDGGLGCGGAFARRGADGSREAARTLLRLLGPSRDVEPREVVVSPAVEFRPERFGAEVVAVGTAISGVVPGRLAMILSTADARRLAERLLRVPLRPGPMGPGERSALCEAGNIVCSAFLTGFGRGLPGFLLPSVPRLCEGAAAAVRRELVDARATAALIARFAIAARERTPVELELVFLTDAAGVAALASGRTGG